MQRPTLIYIFIYDHPPHGPQDKDKEKEDEEGTEEKKEQPTGNRPAREDSLQRAPWKPQTVAQKNIMKEPTPSKPVFEVEESSQSGSSCSSSKKTKKH